MWDVFRIFLQFQGLIVNALTLIRDDVVGVDGTSLQLTGLWAKSPIGGRLNAQHSA